MLSKVIGILGLGFLLNLGSLTVVEEVNKLTNSDTLQRGFPFSYLESANQTVVNEVSGTEFIFSNALFNYIFWLIVSAIILNVIWWVFKTYSKLVLYLVIIGFVVSVAGSFYIASN